MQNLNLNTQYNLPTVKEEFVDKKNGEILSLDKIVHDFNPMDNIKKLANQLNIKINDPKSDCKKCWGRGYIGRDAKTKAPIPCKCIYPKLTKEQQIEQNITEENLRKYSRSERRFLARKKGHK